MAKAKSKIRSPFLCTECGDDLEPTSSSFLACPRGHGKLIPPVVFLEHLQLLYNRDLKWAMEMVDKHLCHLFDLKKISAHQLETYLRKQGKYLRASGLALP